MSWFTDLKSGLAAKAQDAAKKASEAAAYLQEQAAKQQELRAQQRAAEENGEQSGEESEGEHGEEQEISINTKSQKKMLHVVEMRLIIKQARINILEGDKETEHTCRVEFTRSGHNLSTS